VTNHVYRVRGQAALSIIERLLLGCFPRSQVLCRPLFSSNVRFCQVLGRHCFFLNLNILQQARGVGVELQENTQTIFDMLLSGQLTPEQGRVAAADILQLMTDLLDLSDSLARRSQTR
jgi:hypothetical protein